MNEDRIRELASILKGARHDLAVIANAYEAARDELVAELKDVNDDMCATFNGRSREYKASGSGQDHRDAMDQWEQVIYDLDVEVEVPEEVDVLGLPGL